MPIDGLGVTSEGVTISERPWETAAMSDRLRACVAISAALSPDLKVAFVRSGNDFDEDTLEVFRAECESSGLQAWLERIEPGDGDGVIVIEAGKVKS